MSAVLPATCILALSLYVAHIFFPSHAAEKRVASPTTIMDWREVCDKLCQSMIGPCLSDYVCLFKLQRHLSNASFDDRSADLRPLLVKGSPREMAFK
jgi:hypothetical protein